MRAVSEAVAVLTATAVQETGQTAEQKKELFDRETLFKAVESFLMREKIKDTRKYHIETLAVFMYQKPLTKLSFEEILIKIHELFDEEYSESTQKKIKTFISKLVSKDILQRELNIVERYYLDIDTMSEILYIYDNLKNIEQETVSEDNIEEHIEKLVSDFSHVAELRGDAYYIDLTVVANYSEKLVEMLAHNYYKVSQKFLETLNKENNTLIKKIYFVNAPRKIRVKDIDAKLNGKIVTVLGSITTVGELESFIKKAVWVCKDCGYEHVRVNYPVKRSARVDKCEACGSRNVELFIEKSELMNFRRMLVEDSYEFLKEQEQRAQFEAYFLDPPALDSLMGETVELTVIVENDALLSNRKQATAKIILHVIGVEEHKREEGELDDKKFINKIKELRAKLDDREFIDKIVEMLDSYTMHSTNKEKEYLYRMYLFKKAVLYAYLSEKGARADKTLRTVNVLVVGDKGTSKSTFARRFAELVNAEVVSLANASAGGLIGIADRREGWGWFFEAGKLLKAKNNLIFIDEFDKISETDEVASKLLDILATGDFTFNKASIHIKTKLYLSLVAMMNPRGGVFNNIVDAFEQLAISKKEFLDRFSIILFIREGDYRDLVEIARAIHRKRTAELNEVEEQERKALIRTYLHLARSIKIRRWTEDANILFEKRIQELLRGLKNSNTAFSYGMRLVQHLENLAEASAKARLSEEVEAVDVEDAVWLMKESIKSWGVELDEFIEKVELEMDKESRDALVYAKKTVEKLMKKGIVEFTAKDFEDVCLEFVEKEEQVKLALKVAKKFNLIKQISDDRFYIP